MDQTARGRLPGRRPVAVIDIGSNSVRLVIYEGQTRVLTMLFNEKVLCGLGKGLSQTRRLDDKAVESAIAALTRFRSLVVQAGVEEVYPIATAAAREAENGPEFVAAAEAAIGRPIIILSGPEEARYAAEGVAGTFFAPDGIVGDLGGGSLELVRIDGHKIGEGLTLPLGGLRLQDLSGGNIATARAIADSHVAGAAVAGQGKGRTFYAVGGTWRNLAKLLMEQSNYPLHVMHGYEVGVNEWSAFLQAVTSNDPDKLPGIAAVSKNRRTLLAFGAVALQSVIEHLQPASIKLSAFGVREGFLHAMLPEEEQAKDPLIIAAQEYSVLRTRSPRHAEELRDWSTRTFVALGIDETAYEERLRHAACLLDDIGWRAHPDYRGRQSLSVVAHAAFPGVDHPGRAYLGLANYYRHEGSLEQTAVPDLEKLANDRLIYRARVLSSLFRFTYLLTASMPGVLDQLRWVQDPRGGFTLVLPKGLAGLMGDRPENRLQQLAKLVERTLRMEAR
ncbi:Ppx/GppA family phosphatase [Consotaella aegiceratis]|uniref:Ppx/GppA family phosphatase n=1 Tax=Consotaella aegiceratis TaxID=3097961 RepID=UPI002F402710